MTVEVPVKATASVKHGEALELVGACVGTAGRVERDAVDAQVDAQIGIAEDGVREDRVAGAFIGGPKPTATPGPSG